MACGPPGSTWIRSSRWKPSPSRIPCCESSSWGGGHAFVSGHQARALARALEEREGPSPRPILGPADLSPIERTAIQIAQQDWREWIERGAPPYGPNHAPSDRHKHFMDALLTIEDEADGVAFRAAYWAAANRGQGFAW